MVLSETSLVRGGLLLISSHGVSESCGSLCFRIGHKGAEASLCATIDRCGPSDFRVKCSISARRSRQRPQRDRRRPQLASRVAAGASVTAVGIRGPRRSAEIRRFLERWSGGGGIRTPGPAEPVNGFQDRQIPQGIPANADFLRCARPYARQSAEKRCSWGAGEGGAFPSQRQRSEFVSSSAS
jgi:hypothetical protein